MTGTGSRAVRFDRYGDRSGLYVTDVPIQAPAGGEVVVEVKAAAINPGEAAIRSGALADRFPATFPSGEGSDLAGIVSAVVPNQRGRLVEVQCTSKRASSGRPATTAMSGAPSVNSRFSGGKLRHVTCAGRNARSIGR